MKREETKEELIKRILEEDEKYSVHIPREVYDKMLLDSRIHAREKKIDNIFKIIINTIIAILILTILCLICGFFGEIIYTIVCIVLIILSYYISNKIKIHDRNCVDCFQTYSYKIYKFHRKLYKTPSNLFMKIFNIEYKRE